MPLSLSCAGRPARLVRLQVAPEGVKTDSTSVGSTAAATAASALAPPGGNAGKLASMSRDPAASPASKPRKAPLIEELPSKTCPALGFAAARTPSQRASKAHSGSEGSLQHTSGGEGMGCTVREKHDGLQVSVHADEHTPTDALVVEALPAGDGMVVRTPGCEDLRVCAPGYDYSRAQAKRRRKQGLLVVMVPAIAR